MSTQFVQQMRQPDGPEIRRAGCNAGARQTLPLVSSSPANLYTCVSVWPEHIGGDF
jgi:hypothetical protein